MPGRGASIVMETEAARRRRGCGPPRPRASTGAVRCLDRLHDRPRGGVRDRRSGDPRPAPPLRGPLRRLPAGRAAGRVGGRGADRLGDRDPLRARGELRPGDGASARASGAAVRARRGDGARARRHGHASVGQLPGSADHRHPALRAAARGAPLGRPAKQHLEPSRPRGRAGRRSRGRRLRPPAGRAAGAAGAVGELAVPRWPRHRPQFGAHRDLHAHLPALRDPRAVRELEGLPGLHRRRWSAPTRSSRRPSFGGACAPTTPSAPSRCGSATRRREGRSRSRSRP